MCAAYRTHWFTDSMSLKRSAQTMFSIQAQPVSPYRHLQTFTMTRSLFSLLALVAVGTAATIARPLSPASESLATRGIARDGPRDNSGLTPGCKNTNKSRKCWGKYDINTNPYDTIFHTGRTVEYWFNVEEIDCAPDGYRRKCQVVNGTMPGPAIVADWGPMALLSIGTVCASSTTISTMVLLV
jgi:hypothetical protein